MDDIIDFFQKKSYPVWQIENLAIADKLPPKGFLVIVGVPECEKAAGFPARMFAIIP